MSLSSARVAGNVPADRLYWPRPELLASGEGVVPPRNVPVPSATARPVDLRDAPLPAVLAERVAAIEREAFAKGYAEGEREGEAAAVARTESMVRRLERTIDEIAALRAGMVRRTEREIVRLSVAIAERVIRREVAVDQELLVAMARVAIDRLGDQAAATIHLHPSDYDSVMQGRQEFAPGSTVKVVSDPNVARGGCLVRSSFGVIDASIDGQVREVSQALLGAEPDTDPPYDTVTEV